ncbi:hypothetical protein CXB51_024838 [Gossypium anomalum]|uniref:DUF7745 domain-containing protein n=1 Tax=Gossypium anomalum TaxID=47600 RepID=A0A8J5YD56_9ROSI|nr:hypothetical protein CXB51_024838 [Gossypium anomalum]
MSYDRGVVLVLVDDSTTIRDSCQRTGSDGGVNYTNNREECRGSRLVSKNSERKGDSLVEGSVANLPEHTTVNVRQNNLEDLVRVWNQWDSDTRGIFTERYGDIAHLITIRVDEQLIQAMVRFWDPAYQCFTFNQEDMTPTIEEYAAYSASTMCNSARYTVDFFERLKQGVNPVPTILAETFRSLSTCRRVGKGRFVGSLPQERVAERITEQHWVSVFQNLRAEDITWRAPWIRPSVLLYKCGSQDWVPLLGLWGGVGYAPLLVQRQFSSRQFIPATGGLAQFEFAFAGEGYEESPRYCKVLE